MIIARGIMILTCYPLLRGTYCSLNIVFGYPISKAEIIVMVYGGLRGALGICLALMVGVDEQLPARFRHLTVFYMLAMTALTNLINGTTAKSLVMYLKMIEESAVRKKIYKSYLKDVILSSNDKQKDLATDKFFSMVDWSHVK
jgi:NhaP-type Na+/H+ or K+/H+ antiporter